MVALLAVAATSFACECAGASDRTYDKDPVNGHSGFLSAWRLSGELDKPVIVVKGYDTINKEHPIDYLRDKLAAIVQPLIDRGHDIIVFDYVDGEANLKTNADNLAEFVRYLDGLLAAAKVADQNGDGHPDYELTIIGDSMGGIVARTMFVQEREAMGVDIFVTIDSPHHGVHLSPFLEWATDFVDSEAGHQMLYGDDAYFEHYDWLRSIERLPEFKSGVTDPMHTAAIALSDGESAWHLDFDDLVFHTDYHDVSSYIVEERARSDFVPYHSAVNMDRTRVDVVEEDWDYRDLKYVDTRTSYFDRKIPNRRDRHDAPDYAIRQAIEFVIESGEHPRAKAQAWLIPIFDLLMQ